MPMIEGVGDEVFHVLLVVLILVLGIVGWWSTSISEQPLIRTVLILEPRHRTTPENNSRIENEPPQDTGQPDPTASSNVRTEVQAASDTPSSASKNQHEASSEEQAQAVGGVNPGSSSSADGEIEGSSGGPEISPDVPFDSPSSSDAAIHEAPNVTNELRRRRLHFFEERQGVDNVTKICSKPPDHSNDAIQESTEAASSSNCTQEESEQKDATTEIDSSTTDGVCVCDNIRIKLKFLNDNQKLVEGNLQEPLGDFKRRNFAVEIASFKVIRLIFNGQVLQSDDRTLQNYGLFDNCVVHCLVHNQRTTSSNVESATTGNNGEDTPVGGNETGETRDWDLSNVMYISMFIGLSAIWYLRINFSHFFSATSTVALFGLSGIFVIFLVGMYIPDQEVLRT